MQCTHSSKYRKDGTFIGTLPPCGNCLSCKLNDRAVWASRLVCERKAHSNAQFLTLTYRDEDLPGSIPELKKSFQKFTDRYKKHYGQPRYFAALEFGTKYRRAHWHAIFFGSTTSYETRRKNGHSIVVDPTIEDTWQYGSTYVKDCNSSTQAMNITNYIAAYLLKGLWHESDSDDLAKQECSLQSRKPYIGKPLVNKLSELCYSKKGSMRCAALGTVPDRIKFGNRYYRLYSRIRKDICNETGIDYHPVPYNSGIVMDLDGHLILQEKPYGTQTKNQALCHERKIKSKIRLNSRANKTTATG
ncbi:replication initiator protein [Microviridae sp.]|nr:replication initiator protein [Microviridae sp.]